MRSATAISVDALTRRLASLGFSPGEEPLAHLRAYLELLVKWNAAMNLVGVSSWEEILDSLVADSFHLAEFLPALRLPASPLSLDIGAGAGLPGIPLRMLWRDGSYTLIEAREKRALFLRTVLAGMDLGDTRVFHGRAEAFFREAHHPADFIVSRAFMPWRDMLAFINEALAPGGRVAFLANTPAPEDLPEPWKLLAQTAYTANNTRRHLWGIARNAGDGSS